MKVIYFYNNSVMISLFQDVTYAFNNDALLYFTSFNGVADMYFSCDQDIAMNIMHDLFDNGKVDLRLYHINDIILVDKFTNSVI